MLEWETELEESSEVFERESEGTLTMPLEAPPTPLLLSPSPSRQTPILVNYTNQFPWSETLKQTLTTRFQLQGFRVNQEQ